MASSRVLSGCLYGILLARAAAQASQAQLCASVNTASSDPTPNTYQSVGACSTTCTAQFAYAVLQNNLCWCSNYGPDASTQRTGSCRLPCPGYPADVCGGAGGLYSYVLVNAALVRGTKGGDASDSGGQNPPPSKNARPSSSSHQQEQQPPPPPPSSTTTSGLTQTTTLDGVIQTVTVTPTDVASSPDNSLNNSNNNNNNPVQQSSVSTSAIVGIVIGCVSAVILAIAGTACLILSKKRTRHENGEIINDVAGARARGASSSTISNSSTAGIIKNPFMDGSMAGGVYGQRDRAGSIETILPPKEQCLRIVNPDPPEK
ncbi:hypothetical protein E4U43_005348 [Claviceps pusilla]|uniref:WSC domain-containing protein n=1 Tax=Claviceps pusilla TaxID=123648 RepID=A0A9P7N3J7_9HYPO|nr:hypothetical protein E4U43_005348 [Claviceps pusilla]